MLPDFAVLPSLVEFVEENKHHTGWGERLHVKFFAIVAYSTPALPDETDSLTTTLSPTHYVNLQLM